MVWRGQRHHSQPPPRMCSLCGRAGQAPWLTCCSGLCAGEGNERGCHTARAASTRRSSSCRPRCRSRPSCHPSPPARSTPATRLSRLHLKWRCVGLKEALGKMQSETIISTFMLYDRAIEPMHWIWLTSIFFNGSYVAFSLTFEIHSLLSVLHLKSFYKINVNLQVLGVVKWIYAIETARL